jgi:hypothetical protein
VGADVALSPEGALGDEPGLMTLAARLFEDSLLRWYRQQLAPEDPTAQGGLLTVIRRS